MKFQKQTLAVIENFARINQGIIFKQGNVLRTMSVMKNIYATAVLNDTIPREFAIYDLNEFLSVMSLCTDAEINLMPDHVLFDQGRSQTTYYYSAPEIITQPLEKSLVMPAADLSFRLSQDDFLQIQKASSVLKLKEVQFKKSEILILNRGVAGNKQKIAVATEGDTNGKFTFRVENLKFLPRDYDVTISAKGVAQFKTPEEDLIYHVALETGE